MLFKITRNNISPALGRLLKGVKPPQRQRVLQAMGTTFQQITEGAFNSSGAGFRPSPWPAKRDGAPSSLLKSGTLSKNFHLKVDERAARLSNPTKYAAAHQFGVTIKGRPLLKFKIGEQWISARQVIIPARPFFPVQNGRLTAKAEEKIAAAARQVLTTLANAK